MNLSFLPMYDCTISRDNWSLLPFGLLNLRECLSLGQLYPGTLAGQVILRNVVPLHPRAEGDAKWATDNLAFFWYQCFLCGINIQSVLVIIPRALEKKIYSLLSEYRINIPINLVKSSTITYFFYYLSWNNEAKFKTPTLSVSNSLCIPLHFVL